LAATTLGACGEPAFDAQIADEIQAAGGGAVVGFELSGQGVEHNLLQMSARGGDPELFSADVAAAIAVIDTYSEDDRLGAGYLRLEVTDDDPNTAASTRVGWERAWQGSGQELNWIVTDAMAYGEWMCELPTLRVFAEAGPGSDFRKIGECSPALERLSIASWDRSTGHDGLTNLEELRWLRVGDGLATASDLPALDGLSHLTLPASADTPENRAYLQDRYPGCDVDFAAP
jgi:hypothetical protein